MNRICSYCGNIIEDDVNKYRINNCCPKCGWKIEGEEEDYEFWKIKY